ELARVRNARVRRDAGREHGHLVVDRERPAVAAEVEQRVAERAVRRSVLRVEVDRSAREPQPLPELVPRVGERRPALLDQGQSAAGGGGTRECPARQAVEGGVAGLSRALLVGEAEQRQRVRVLWVNGD